MNRKEIIDKPKKFITLEHSSNIPYDMAHLVIYHLFIYFVLLFAIRAHWANARKCLILWAFDWTGTTYFIRDCEPTPNSICTLQ